MRKVGLILILFIGIFQFTFAQKNQVKISIYPFHQGKYWGYRDASGKIIVPAEYSALHEFTNGVAKVEKCGIIGYINAEGKVIVPCKYSSGSFFEKNYAQVLLGDKKGMINKDGIEVVPCKYTNVKCSFDGLFIVKLDSLFGVCDAKGKILIPCKYDEIYELNDVNGLFTVSINGKTGVIDKKGKTIIPLNYELIRKGKDELIDVEGNKIIKHFDFQGKELTEKTKTTDVFEKNDGAGKFRFVNENGELIYDSHFESVIKIEDGLFFVKSEGKWGVINLYTKRYVVDPNWDFVEEYKLGRSSYIVGVNKKFGLFDAKQKKEVISPRYEKYKIVENYDEAAILFYQAGKQGLFSFDGKELIACKFDTLFSILQNTDYVVLNNKKYGLYNSNSGMIVPCKYDSVFICNTEIDRYYQVIQNKKNGVFNTDGTEVVSCKYDSLAMASLDYPMFAVKLNGKYGVVEPVNYEFVSCKYDNPLPINELFDDFYGAINVKRGGKYGLLNIDGKEVFNCEYDSLINPAVSDLNYVEVIKNKRRAIADKNGKIVIQFKYDKFVGDYLSLDYGKFCNVELNGKFGKVGIDGKEIMICKYDMPVNMDTYPLAVDHVEVIAGGKHGLIDSYCKEIIPCKYDVNILDDAGNTEIDKIKLKYGIFSVKRNGKSGFVNRKGVEMLECKYDSVFTDMSIAGEINRLYFKKGDKFGIADTNGKIIKEAMYNKITPIGSGFTKIIKGIDTLLVTYTGGDYKTPLYNNIISFSEGMGKFKVDGNFGYMDSKLKISVEPFYTVAEDFKNGYAVVGKENKYGVVDKLGKEVIPIRFDKISSASATGIFAYYENGKIGFIDKSGKVLCVPAYTNVEFHEYGIVPSIDNKVGLMNDKGFLIIPIQYEKIEVHSDFVLAYLDKKYSLFDIKGKIITKKPVDDINFLSNYIQLENGLLFGLIDRDGKEITPIKYTKIADFKGNYANVEINGKYGVIDIMGKEVVPCMYSTLTFESEFERYQYVINDENGHVKFCGFIPFSKK